MRKLIETFDDELKGAFKALLDQVDELPSSREKSLAITKLEEAALWVSVAQK